MTRVKVLEWNVNNRDTKSELPEWVGEEIANKNPDIFCLVEWRDNGVNMERIEKALGEDYSIEAYDGAEYDNEQGAVEKNEDEKTKQSNGILIGVRKELFEIISIGNAKYHQIKKVDGKWHGTRDKSIQKFDEPDWLKLVLELKSTKERIDIVGFKVRIIKESKADLLSRQEQLNFLISTDSEKIELRPEKEVKKQILLGDLNYGQHNDEYREKAKQYNWSTIKELVWKNHYFNKQDDKRFYTPNGTSYKAKTLDWIITKDVKTIETSDYNQLDWSFGKHNKKHPYVNGYFVPEGYFIRTNPGYPDHAILTQEIELDY